MSRALIRLEALRVADTLQITDFKAGNMRAPPLPTMAQWVLESWHDVKDHVVVKSFKKCCISNAMDGS